MQDEVKVLGRIGEGAFGEVSLATCAIFGKVAVKWLKVGTLKKHFHSVLFIVATSHLLQQATATAVAEAPVL